MDVYLNDHLAGSMVGTDLAKQIRDRAEGTELGTVMTGIAAEIEEDQQTLVDLMAAMDVTRNQVKQATGWLAEKASRIKFRGATSGEPDHGLFMALESLRLGVAGKKCVWLTLREVQGDHPALAEFDLEGLTARASAQEATLERERMAAGTSVLAATPAPA